MSLPWVKVYTELPTHRKSALLAVETGDRRAWTYVIALILWAGKNAGDGRIRGPQAAGLIEMAVEWMGEPGRLVRGMVAAGFLEVPADGDGYAIHDWASEQGAHVAKLERDRRKPRGNKASSLEAPSVPPASRAGPARDPADVPRGTSAGLSLVSNLSSQEEMGCGEEKAPPKPVGVASEKSKPALDANGDSVMDRLGAVFREVRGYAWKPHRAQDVGAIPAALSACEGDEAELLRRWRIGLATRFPRCRHLRDLAEHWNSYGGEEAGPPGKPPDVTRGVVRAEAAKHAPPGVLEDF